MHGAKICHHQKPYGPPNLRQQFGEGKYVTNRTDPVGSRDSFWLVFSIHIRDLPEHPSIQRVLLECSPHCGDRTTFIMPKLTIHDFFQAKKEGRQFVEIRTSDPNEALACAEAGVEIIMCMK